MAHVGPANVLRGHFGEVQALDFLSEEHLYTGDGNGELRLWDLSSCRPEYAVRLHDTQAGLLGLTAVPSYGVLVSQGRDGCVKLWAAGQMGALDRSQPLHEVRTESFNFCRCAVWAPGGGASRGAGGVVGPHAAPSPGRLQDLRIACASHDPADIGVWRPAEAPTAGVLLRQPAGDPKHGMCMSLAFLAPPQAPAAAAPAASAAHAAPSSALSGDTTTGASGPDTKKSKNADECGADGAALSDECPGASGATNSSSGGSSSSGRGVESIGAAGAARESSACGVADPRYLVAGYEDGVVALWDLRCPGRPLGTLRLHGEPVMCLDARASTAGGSAGGERAAGGGREGGSNGGGAGGGGRAAIEGMPAVYDMVSGSADDQISCCVVRPSEAQPLTLGKQLQLRQAGTGDVRIRRDGKLFACGCWDGRVRLYSLRRREPLAVLKYHRGQVTAVAFSPLTNTLATASRDTTVALWSVYSSPAPCR